MSEMNSERSNHDAAAAATLQSNTHAAVAQEAMPLSTLAAASGHELDVEAISPLIQQVASASVREIDELIADLQAARDYLQSEGERIQREATRFTRLNHTASASVKLIAENLTHWRNVHASSAA